MTASKTAKASKSASQPQPAPVVEPENLVESAVTNNGKLVITLTPRGSYKVQGVASLCEGDAREWLESTLRAGVRADIEGAAIEVQGQKI